MVYFEQVFYELIFQIPNGDFMCVYQTGISCVYTKRGLHVCIRNGNFVYAKRGPCVCQAGKLCIPTGEYIVRSS